MGPALGRAAAGPPQEPQPRPEHQGGERGGGWGAAAVWWGTATASCPDPSEDQGQRAAMLGAHLCA